MSLQYLLDGYNIIYQVPALARGSLEEQRAKLIRFIEDKRPQGSFKNKVTIVFDGQPQHFGSTRTASVKIIFSQNETADERILRLVDDAQNRKNMIVVTEDRPLQYAVRALGAEVMKVDSFIIKGEPRLLSRRTPKGDKAPKETAKEISMTDEMDITSEMQKIWLKKER